MRMMKNNNNETVMVIGIDHGYGNMKTATRCFPSDVARYDKEPIFQNNLLVYNGMYYQIGEEHKEFCAEKTQDEDYYVNQHASDDEYDDFYWEHGGYLDDGDYETYEYSEDEY